MAGGFDKLTTGRTHATDLGNYGEVFYGVGEVEDGVVGFQ